MKRKFFQWEECVSLREVKVYSVLSNWMDHIRIQKILSCNLVLLTKNYPSAGTSETNSPKHCEAEGGDDGKS